MRDFKNFIVSVGASIVASLVILNFDKLKKYRPSRSPRKAKMPNKRGQLQRSHPTISKQPLSRR